MTSEYQKAIKILTSQGKFYINLGLERITSILDLLGKPQEQLKIIHIAGTNGKGSVASTIANILKCAKYKTGLYTSPHLIEYTERIKINNNDISKEDFSSYVIEICNLAEKNSIPLTEFEILTATAYKYFADKNVDFAVIETGLGGRYDATNVCSNPILSIITSISLDHTDRLGQTLEEITFEKAGIIKENSTVIISQDNKGFLIVKKIAKEKNCKLISSKNNIKLKFENEINYAIINGKEYVFPLLGLYQKENLELITEAVKYLEIDEIYIKEGLRSAKWRARLEFIKDKNILIDGAHNPDAAYQLRKSLDLYFKKTNKIFLYSTISTKNYKEIAKILFKEDDEIYFYEFNHKDAITFEEYTHNINFLKNIQKIKEEDITKIFKKDGLKIITGSLYMIGEIYKKFNII